MKKRAKISDDKKNLVECSKVIHLKLLSNFLSNQRRKKQKKMTTILNQQQFSQSKLFQLSKLKNTQIAREIISVLSIKNTCVR